VLRRGRAVEPQLQLLDERELHLGKRLRLPAAGTGLLWAQIEVRPALLGKLVHSIYKSPHVLITIRTADRVERTYQLVPALAKAGFLLSPLVGDTGAFAAISRRATPENDVVRSITITSPDAPVGFWQQYITIRLYELSIPPPQ
jgi:hypothetical protein